VILARDYSALTTSRRELKEESTCIPYLLASLDEPFSS